VLLLVFLCFRIRELLSSVFVRLVHSISPRCSVSNVVKFSSDLCFV